MKVFFFNNKFELVPFDPVLPRHENSSSMFLKQSHFEAKGLWIFNIVFLGGSSSVLVVLATIKDSGVATARLGKEFLIKIKEKKTERLIGIGLTGR